MSNQPFRVSDLVKKSLTLSNQNTLLFVGIIGLVYVPVYVMYFFIVSFFNIDNFIASNSVSIALDSLIGVVSTAAMYSGVQYSVLKKSISFGKIAKMVALSWPTLFVTQLMLLALSLPLYLFLIVPGMVFGVYWMFAVQVTIFEHKFGWSALRRSFNLINHRWFHFFSFVVILFVARWLILIPYNSLTFFVPTDSLIGVVAVNVFLEILLIPFTVAQALLYFYAIDTYKSPEKKPSSPTLQKAVIR